jgi:hypothetical protein
MTNSNGDDPAGRVRGRAYSIWEADGRPEGKAAEHWLQAEREMANGDVSPVDGPVLEPGESAEGGIEDVIDRDEEVDPAVPGSAALIDAP